MPFFFFLLRQHITPAIWGHSNNNVPLTLRRCGLLSKENRLDRTCVEPALHIWRQAGNRKLFRFLASLGKSLSRGLPKWDPGNLYFLNGVPTNTNDICNPEADKNTTERPASFLKRLPPHTLLSCALTRSLSILSKAVVRLVHQLWTTVCEHRPKLCVKSFPLALSKGKIWASTALETPQWPVESDRNITRTPGISQKVSASRENRSQRNPEEMVSGG